MGMFMVMIPGAAGAVARAAAVAPNLWFFKKDISGHPPEETKDKNKV
jgi:hypothetical protein